MHSCRKTYSKNIYSLDELNEYLSTKKDIHTYSFISYIWHEYGFFPIYFNELFEDFFQDCCDEPIIATCFAGHEFFYEGKVDELIVLNGFIDTSRAYKNSQKTRLFQEKLDHHANRSIAFWFTIRNFDEDNFQKIIDAYQFKRELFSIGKKTTWFYHLHPGPRESRPYQYARGKNGKKYFLPKDVTPWQTEKKLGWSLDKWQSSVDHPKVIQGDYCAIFVKKSFKTEDEDGKKRFGYIDNDFLKQIINYFIKKQKKLVIIHDLVEHSITTSEYIHEVRMVGFFDTKLYLSIVHHANIFISSATSPIDLAAYYCNTHLVLLDDQGNKIDWATKVTNIRGKECIASQSRNSNDAEKVIQFIDEIEKPKTIDSSTTRKLNIGGTSALAGWEIYNGMIADYVDHLGDASDLSRFQDKTFDIIYSSHTLEHISYWNDLLPTLKEWKRVLKDDGQIMISVPDLDVLCSLFADKQNISKKQRFSTMRVIYGGQYHQYDYHYAGFNIEIIDYFATLAGLTIKKRVKQFDIFKDASKALINNQLISLNVILKKQIAD